MEQADMDDRTAARAARDQRILEMRRQGHSQSAIAAALSCAQGTVSRVIASQTPEGRERIRQMAAKHNLAHAQQRQEYRSANAERKAEYDRQYRRDNAGRIAEYRRAYADENADQIRVRGHRYREVNGERIRDRKRERWSESAADLNARRRASYDDAQRERARNYRIANIEASREVVRRRKRRDGLGLDRADRLLAAEYRKAIAADPCAYCDSPGEQVDHLQPLSRGGTGHWWNLHRTCRDCNCRKHTKTHEEFVAFLAAS